MSETPRRSATPSNRLMGNPAPALRDTKQLYPFVHHIYWYQGEKCGIPTKNKQKLNKFSF